MTPPLDPTRWPEIKRLFEAALDQPSDLRASFLDRACRQPDGQPDADLRTAVDTLLQADSEADTDTTGGFLERSPMVLESLLHGMGIELAEAPAEAEPGTRIGPYRVIRLLGRGGMGEVYLAARADGLFERTVALKRVRADLAPGVADRFATERQILADLVHPGIARLYAAGTDDDGRPWLAMEPVVDGIPMPDYARDRGLSVRQRVELVLQVCAAVQHAHQRLVVHRDLKPSNVLVTDAEEGARVQLLDFGIARILGNDADTRRFLTRAYAAPEQLRGEAATTASDLYGLGTLLVETVTNTRPAASESGLEGDLGAIARRARAPEPADRYASAEALAADLRRYLDGHPVAAQSPTWAYRARRFVSRHRIPVGMAVLALGLVASAMLVAALRVTEERDIARQAAADAEAVAEAQGQILRVLEPTFRAELDTSSTNPASPTVTEVVEEAIETVEDAYEDSPAVLAQSLVTLATTLYERGEYARADSLFARAVVLRRPLRGDADKVVHDALLGRGLVAQHLGQKDSARGFFRQALEIERDHPEVVPDGSSTEMFLAGVLDDSQAAEATLLRTLSERQADLAASPTTEIAISVAQAHNALGVHYFTSGNYRRAFAEYRAAESIVRQHYGELHGATNTLRSNLAYASAEMGQYEEAERHARIALDAAQRGGLGRSREALLRQAIGQALFFQGRTDDADRELRAALAGFEQEHGPDAPATLGVLNSLVVVVAQRGQLQEALETTERVAAANRTNGTSTEASRLFDRAVQAALRFALGDRESSLEQLEGVLRDLRQLEVSPVQREAVLRLVGEARRASGDAEGAEPLLREALAAVREAKPDAHWNVLHARLAYGQALAALGRMDEARPHLEAVRGKLRRVSFPAVLDDVDAEIDRLLGRS